MVGVETLDEHHAAPLGPRQVDRLARLPTQFLHLRLSRVAQAEVLTYVPGDGEGSAGEKPARRFPRRAYPAGLLEGEQRPLGGGFGLVKAARQFAYADRLGDGNLLQYPKCVENRLHVS